MNEQDFMNKIDDKTKHLQIPDSITPDNMKKMLDETLQNQKSFEDEKMYQNDTDTSQSQNDNTGDGNNGNSPAGKKNRYIRWFSAAACIALVLFGAAGISHINHKNTTSSGLSVKSDETNSYDTESAEEVTEDSPITGAGGESGFESDLAYQTTFHTPDSYEDYFHAVKDAYDAYYDRISTVETNGFDDIAEDYEVGATESAAEDAIDMGSSTGSRDNSITALQDSKESSRDSAKTKNEDYSKTNTQEKNIDEGDIIKTDGSYIYKVSPQYDENTWETIYTLNITKADNGKLTPMASLNLNKEMGSMNSEDTSFDFHEFYLYKDQLIILYTLYNYNTDNQEIMSYIAIYDIRNRKEPKLKKTLSQSGWYEASRISDGYLYTITNYSSGNFNDITRYKDYIPTVDNRTISCKNIYYSDNVLMDTAHVITSLNLDKPTEFTDSKSVPVNGSTVYVSDNAIYFYATIYDSITKTEIMKMYYENGQLTVGPSAVIAGYLYGPFAINEYNGHLRIVATIPANNISLLRSVALIDTTNSSGLEVREDVNALYILDDSLSLTGKLTGIAPGEMIYSARFIANTGYFVTYKNMDPLFSVDLSDPANPVILGSLKIPGFSNYLHPYGDGILLGLGEETDPKTQENLGLKLSMFDISNPANVTEEDKHIIENAWYSTAQYDYKSMMIDPEKNIFGFYYYASDSYYYATYAYSEEYGFVETAKYLVNDGSQYEDSNVRGLFIGDYFYLCTNRQITSYKLNSEEMIDKITFK